jgi:hypothetical protein
MKPMNYLLYSQNRTLLNTLRIPDKSLEQYLNFASRINQKIVHI